MHRSIEPVHVGFLPVLGLCGLASRRLPWVRHEWAWLAGTDSRRDVSCFQQGNQLFALENTGSNCIRVKCADHSTGIQPVEGTSSKICVILENVHMQCHRADNGIGLPGNREGGALSVYGIAMTYLYRCPQGDTDPNQPIQVAGYHVIAVIY